MCVIERERERERERENEGEKKKSVFGFRKSTIKQMPEFAFEPVAPLLSN